MDREERAGDFLPPEPSGPEPELGGTAGPSGAEPDPADQPTQVQPETEQPTQVQPGTEQHAQAWQQAQQPGWQQPPPPGYGWQPAPPGWQAQGAPPQGQQGQAAPPQGQPWAQPPPGWQPPPPGWQPAPYWGYPPAPREPDNGAAVAGFVTSLVSAGLLVMSFGFLGILSLIASPFGIHYSRKGKRNVDEGRTLKHRGLAQAGFVIGIITLVISAIVTVLGIIFIIALATDEEFRRDFENDGGEFDSTGVPATLLAVRLALQLLG